MAKSTTGDRPGAGVLLLMELNEENGTRRRKAVAIQIQTMKKIRTKTSGVVQDEDLLLRHR